MLKAADDHYPSTRTEFIAFRIAKIRHIESRPPFAWCSLILRAELDGFGIKSVQCFAIRKVERNHRSIAHSGRLTIEWG